MADKRRDRMTKGNSPVPIAMIRVDGHHKFGFGHLFRCLNIATAIRQRGSAIPMFLTLSATLESGFDRLIEQFRFDAASISGTNPYEEDLTATKRAIDQNQPAVIITDLLTPDPSDRDLLDDELLNFVSVPAYINTLHKWGLPTISITDEIERILIRPDVVIDHSCHFPAEDYGQVPGSIFYLGPSYFPLGPDFAPHLARRKSAPEKATNILMMFGASDHNNFTLRSARQLSTDPDLTMTVVLGPAVKDRGAISKELESLGARVLASVPSVAKLIFEADLAITTGGNTCFEFAALGTPALTLCTRERQNQNANYFESRGCIVNLGIGTQVADVEIGDAAAALINDRSQRETMSNAGRRTVDGKGLERIVEIVSRCTTSRQALPI